MSFDADVSWPIMAKTTRIKHQFLQDPFTEATQPRFFCPPPRGVFGLGPVGTDSCRPGRTWHRRTISGALKRMPDADVSGSCRTRDSTRSPLVKPRHGEKNPSFQVFPPAFPHFFGRDATQRIPSTWEIRARSRYAAPPRGSGLGHGDLQTLLPQARSHHKWLTLRRMWCFYGIYRGFMGFIVVLWDF